MLPDASYAIPRSHSRHLQAKASGTIAWDMRGGDGNLQEQLYTSANDSIEKSALAEKQ